jgi:hypothetical protein
MHYQHSNSWRSLTESLCLPKLGRRPIPTNVGDVRVTHVADVSGRQFSPLHQSHFTLSCDTSMIMRADR